MVIRFFSKNITQLFAYFRKKLTWLFAYYSKTLILLRYMQCMRKLCVVVLKKKG